MSDTEEEENSGKIIKITLVGEPGVGKVSNNWLILQWSIFISSGHGYYFNMSNSFVLCYGQIGRDLFSCEVAIVGPAPLGPANTV